MQMLKTKVEFIIPHFHSSVLRIKFTPQSIPASNEKLDLNHANWICWLESSLIFLQDVIFQHFNVFSDLNFIFFLE